MALMLKNILHTKFFLYTYSKENFAVKIKTYIKEFYRNGIGIYHGVDDSKLRSKESYNKARYNEIEFTFLRGNECNYVSGKPVYSIQYQC